MIELLASAVAARKSNATNGSNILVDTELLEIQGMLDRGQLKLTDATIFATKEVSLNQRIRMFETQDVEAKGITNVTAAKLMRNQLVLVDRIRVLAATSPVTINGAAAVLGGLAYEGIRGHGGMVGGTITVRQANKNVNYQVGLRVFDTTGRPDAVTGLYYLEAPIVLRPQQLMEANLELGRAMPDRQAVRIELLGTQTSSF